MEKLTQISINTNFHNDNIPRERSQCICLWVIWIDSVFRTGDNYYPQVFLEECKYAVKEKKIMPEHITDNIEIFSEINRKDSYGENSNEENSNEEE